MEPLKPSDRARILESNPQAAPEDIEEYEHLLSVRFVRDPDLASAPLRNLEVAADDVEERLSVLHAKLFGGR